MMDLETLLRAARAGEPRAWSQLTGVLFQRLHAYFRRSTSESEAEDLAQTVMLRTWEKLPGLASEQSLVGWVFTVARNLLHEHQRFGAREAKLHDRIVPIGRSDGLITAAQKAMLIEVLGEEIEKLPGPMREVVEHDLDEAGNLRDIAERHGVALSTVRMWRAKARTDLRAGVEERTQTPTGCE